jgi:hypothetical protein
VVASIKMQEHAGSDKSCVWHALDFADGELKEEMFAIRFGSVESEHPIFSAALCFCYVVHYLEVLAHCPAMHL